MNKMKNKKLKNQTMNKIKTNQVNSNQVNSNQVNSLRLKRYGHRNFKKLQEITRNFKNLRFSNRI